MDIETARSILKVPPDATIKQIRKRYRALSKDFHPDVPITGDHDRFVLISTAYFVLQGKEFGIETSSSDTVKDDLLYATRLKKKIDDHFDEVTNKFIRDVENIANKTREKVKNSIYDCERKSQLSQVIKNDVSKALTDAKARITNSVNAFRSEIGGSEGDFIYDLFKGIYEERRRYWITTFYRNPIFIGEVIGQGFIFAIANFPYFSASKANITELWSLGAISLFLLAIGGVLMLIHYIMLDPRSQFLPPSLSVGNVHSRISNASNNLPITDTEFLTGGASVGALLGTVALPGIGTLIGAALGCLAGFFGKNFSEIQRESYKKIISPFDDATEQLVEAVQTWSKEARVEFLDASLQSFNNNVHKLLEYTERKKLPMGRIVDRARLLE